MKLQDRFFPRVWDGKKYWYPVFSELRITYECPDLPFSEENLRDLTWALDWHFPMKAEGGKLEVLNEELEFNHIIEGCVGKRDINEKLIYEGDIVKVWHINQYLYGVIEWSTIYNGYFIMTPSTGYIQIENGENVEIVGDIHHDLDIYSDLICAIGDKDD